MEGDASVVTVGPSGNTPERDVPPPDANFDEALIDVAGILSNARRVYLMRLLVSWAEWPVSDIADVISSVEAGEDDRNHRKSVYVSLLQVHLPKLADEGVIDYDEDRKIVRRGERYPMMRALLECVTNTVESRQ